MAYLFLVTGFKGFDKTLKTFNRQQWLRKREVQAIDVRLLGRPENFSGDGADAVAKWSDWSFVLRSDCAAISGKVSFNLEDASQEVDVIDNDLMDAEAKKYSVTLYYLLGS